MRNTVKDGVCRHANRRLIKLCQNQPRLPQTCVGRRAGWKRIFATSWGASPNETLVDSAFVGRVIGKWEGIFRKFHELGFAGIEFPLPGSKEHRLLHRLLGEKAGHETQTSP